MQLRLSQCHRSLLGSYSVHMWGCTITLLIPHCVWPWPHTTGHVNTVWEVFNNEQAMMTLSRHPCMMMAVLTWSLGCQLCREFLKSSSHIAAMLVDAM